MKFSMQSPKELQCGYSSCKAFCISGDKGFFVELLAGLADFSSETFLLRAARCCRSAADREPATAGLFCDGWARVVSVIIVCGPVEPQVRKVCCAGLPWRGCELWCPFLLIY